MLGAASGAVAGLVAITPAAGNVGIPGAFVIGTAAGLVCLWGVSGLKKMLGADDSLDVFGVHAIGGILGALLTGVFNSPPPGGPSFSVGWFVGTAGPAKDEPDAPPLLGPDPTGRRPLLLFERLCSDF